MLVLLETIKNNDSQYYLKKRAYKKNILKKKVKDYKKKEKKKVGKCPFGTS